VNRTIAMATKAPPSLSPILIPGCGCLLGSALLKALRLQLATPSLQ